MNKNMPRVMIAGTNSGCGKTTIVCGILAALKQAGIKAASCKCGPDYIDPMFHSQVLGIPSQNLDLFFLEENEVCYLMSENNIEVDLTVIEGVMGYFDGMGIDTVKASSYDLARATHTPVILVINCQGMALSIIPLIKGFLDFEQESQIRGIILNGVTPSTGAMLKEIIERELPVKVYGCVPKLSDFKLSSRHLGLVTPLELENIKEELQQLGKEMTKYIAIQDILELGKTAPPISTEVPQKWQKALESRIGEGINLGIAWDKAFCFYYKDNLRLLEKLGCKLTYFSPLEDKNLPEHLDGIILGGGYPELYTQQLAANESFRQDLKAYLESGLPCLAECGGFMYLHEYMEDEEGTAYPMVGIIPGMTSNQGKLVRFGYISLQANKENPYLKDGESIKAHEFHYWDSTNNGEVLCASKPSGKRKWLTSHIEGNSLVGYPHLYYYSNIEFILRFLKQCKGGE